MWYAFYLDKDFYLVVMRMFSDRDALGYTQIKQIMSPFLIHNAAGTFFGSKKLNFCLTLP